MKKNGFFIKSAISLVASGLITSALAVDLFDFGNSDIGDLNRASINWEKAGYNFPNNTIIRGYATDIFEISNSLQTPTQGKLTWSSKTQYGNLDVAGIPILILDSSIDVVAVNENSNGKIEKSGETTLTSTAYQVVRSVRNGGGVTFYIKLLLDKTELENLCNDTYTVTLIQNSIQIPESCGRERDCTDPLTLHSQVTSNDIVVTTGKDCTPDDTTVININNQTSTFPIKVEFDKESRPDSKIGTIKSENGKTIIQAPAYSYFIKSGSNIVTTLKTESGTSQIITLIDGSVNANLKFGTKEVELKLPKGANAKLGENGEFRVINEIEVDGKKLKSATVIDKNGNVKVTVKTTSGEIKTMSLPEAVENKNIEILSSGFIGVYRLNGGKIEFENLSRNGQTVEIIGTSNWQKFEERQNFDGTRTLTLTQGDADILRDGVAEEMEKNREYEVPSVNGTESDFNLDLNSTDSNETQTPPTLPTENKLILNSGWNLVALPTDKKVEDLSIFDPYNKIFTYKDNNWSNPAELNPNEGFWIHLNPENSKKLTFDGQDYSTNLDNIKSGWNLLGTGKNLEIEDETLTTYTYDSIDKKWNKNPEIISSGEGFWLKK